MGFASFVVLPPVTKHGSKLWIVSLYISFLDSELGVRL